MKTIVWLFLLLLTFSMSAFTQENDEVCKGSFRQVVFGESIGTTGLSVVDIDNDGIDEMILSAGDETFEDGRYWYILEYVAAEQTFKQTWVSPYYTDRIMTMSVLDIDGNGVFEVVLGLQSGRAEIYSTADMSLVSSFAVDHTNTGYYNEGVVTVLNADADNDGETELVFLSIDSTYIYSGYPPVQEYVIPIGGQDIVCGNVDNESSLELCYSKGEVVRLRNGMYTVLWDFYGNQNYGYSRIGLADQDGDGNDEIFACGNNTIQVWDVETQSEKYSMAADIDPLAFYLADTDDDGIKELYYGEADWGNVYCRLTTTGEVLWSRNYGHGGLNCLATGNVDDEPAKEIIWAIAHGSTGEDYLYTFDPGTQEQEWQSESVNGPFEKIQVFDVDNDGIEELITLAPGTSNYYNQSQVSFWDPYTHEQEWKSPGNLFYYSTVIFDFAIFDTDHDGVSEIVLPTSKNYKAALYVLDPVTHQIQNEYFYDNPEKFTDIAIADPDNDGKMEYILGAPTTVMVVDVETAVVEWSLPEYHYFDHYHCQLMVENIDQDPAGEIILFSDSLKIIDGVTHAVVTVGDNIASYDLYDLDNDGYKEIIFGTTTGKIGVVDSPGTTISWLPVQMEKRIGGLRVDDLTGSSEPELIFVSSGRVWFSTLEGHIEYTAKVSRDEYYEHWHVNECIEISDFDHNGEKEVFVGGSFQVTELGTHCYQCVDFIATTEMQQSTCEPGSDGRIAVTATGGLPPYTYAWNTGSTGSEINGLEPGTYHVVSTDHVGCVERNEVILLPPVFDAHLEESYITGCNAEHAARLSPEIVEGLLPVTYQWNNGYTGAVLETTDPGTYSVTMTDSRNCAETLTTEVMQETFTVTGQLKQITCHDSPARVTLTPLGQAPLTYLWSNGATGATAEFSVPGNYTVTITGPLGCSQVSGYEIEPYQPIVLNYSVVPDNPFTPPADGSIDVSVTGGFPPYSIGLSDNYGLQVDSISGLKPGTYQVYLSDSKWCVVRTSIDLPLGDNRNFATVYPVPATDWLTIDLGINYHPDFPADFVLWNMRGKEIISGPIAGAITRLNLTTLPEAIYMLRVRLNGSKQEFKVEKVH